MAIESGDGCTGWFDGWNDAGRSWRECCDTHDWQMHSNTDIVEWLKAGVELSYCVGKIDVFMGLVMGIGVLSPIGLGLFIWGRKKKGTR